METAKIRWRSRVCAVVFVLAAIGWASVTMRPADEVVLTIGESYEQVRQQSHSTLPAATEDNHVNLYIRRPAIFKFSDPQYGFTTPASKFLSVYANRGGDVESITVSPQLEALPLGEATAILVDLQDQLRRGGWQPFEMAASRPINDTAALGERLRACDGPVSRWQAGVKFQVSLGIRCFHTDRSSNGERYLVTLALGRPVFEDFPGG